MARERRRTYAWELPVRLTHWLNVLCIIAFTVTGLYIGNPYLHAISSQEYIMGWMRFIHFVSAFLFLMSIIVRIYWAGVGNGYASWRAWLPLTGKQRSDLWRGVRFYLFTAKTPPSVVGHTALAGLSYLFLFALFLFQIVSGFALYSLSSQGVVQTFLGGWLTGLMSLQAIRLSHHLVTYGILSFAALHVYIAWYNDLEEQNGLMGSIFTGNKFVPGKE